MLQKLMFKVLKTAVVGAAEGKTLVSIDVKDPKKQLSSTAVDIGTKAKMFVSGLPDNLVKREFLIAVKNCYITVIYELQKKLPLENSILRYLHCLHPLLRQEERSEAFAISLANIMRNVFENDEERDRVRDKW